MNVVADLAAGQCFGEFKPMSGGSDIYDDIIKTLKQNGEAIDDDQFRRLALFAFVDLGIGRKKLDAIEKKVDILERNSIVLIAKKYPKSTGAILLFAVAFVISVISHLELWRSLFGMLGIELP